MLPSEGNLISNFKKFGKTIFGADTFWPIVLIVLIKIVPDISDAGTYILNDEMGWEGFDLSLNNMVTGVGYYLMMLYLVNKAKNLSFKYQAAIAASANVLAILTTFRFLFYEEFTYMSMFIVTIVNNFMSQLNTDLLLIGVVARFSVKCPKGIESFGIVSIAAILNFSGTAGLMFGARLMKYYGIKKGHYENLGPPTLITYICSLFVLLLTPILGR